MEQANYTPEAIKAAANTLVIGRKIELHAQVGSTNDLARAAGRRGAPEGLVVLAEEQVRGRGRLGRTWTAPPGSSILCSVLLRPRFPAEYAFYLTIAASLAIYRAVGALGADDRRPTTDDGRPRDEGRRTKDERRPAADDRQSIGDEKPPAAALTKEGEAKGRKTKDEGEPATRNPQPPTNDAILHSAFRIPHSIKWPNDVLVRGKKVAGILSESEFVGGEWAFAVVGFGVNVNLDGVDLDKLQQVAPQATSLSHEFGEETDRVRLLAAILRQLEALYLALDSGQFAVVYDGWVRALDTIGKQVSVMEAEGRVQGRAVSVDRDGALVIRTQSGATRRVLAADVE